VLLYAFWVVTGASQLAGAGHQDEFHGFLTSHTGSGTFFGTVCVFLSLYGYEKRCRFCMLIGLLCLAAVAASASRAALSGVLAVLLWYLAIRNPKPRILILAATLMMIMISLVPYISEKTWNRSAGVLSVDFLFNTVAQAEVTAHSDWQPGDWATDENSDDYLQAGDTNALMRIMLWTYATKRFLDSPALGIGWGRFNDRDVELITLPGIGVFALDGEPIFAAASAHNSYVHILAENGLFGLLLLVAIPIILYFRFNRAVRKLSSFRDERAYFIACQGLIVYAAVCALTGHALASPSMMVPVATLVGVGMSFLRTNFRLGALVSAKDEPDAPAAQPIG
jgi:O-antigen ligase